MYGHKLPQSMRDTLDPLYLDQALRLPPDGSLALIMVVLSRFKLVLSDCARPAFLLGGLLGGLL